MPLAVYKSSAGSGKTTTLVNEYLKIALNKPATFRNILAITFTNKAANEMKDRVVETLQLISTTDLPIDNKYSELISDLNLEPLVLKSRAQKLLTLILHNYDEFAISTIDSFIHKIVRTFATDVQLPQNFEVVIDDSDIVPEIIQNLYSKVGYDSVLTKILLDFTISEISEESNYDPTSKLVEFVSHHLKEDGFKHIKKLDNLDNIDLIEVIKKIKKNIDNSKSEIIKKSNEALDLCKNKNLENKDFYQGRTGIMAYFEKVNNFKLPDDKLFPGKNVTKTISEDKWFSAKADSSTQNAILSISNELIIKLNYILKLLSTYIFYRLIYSKIYSLALVHEIRKIFVDTTNETGKVHISEFNKKISDEIADQPVPFIYERLGRKYRYFLIDEFQDTSLLQWHNLLPLIEESLANNNFNMLVGDAKQAIYRFRNGEVELFASLPDLYGNDGSPISLIQQETLHQNYIPKNLTTNWRSTSEIVRFNNDFFKTLLPNLSDRTQQIYADSEQIIPKKNKDGGVVSLNFYQSDSQTEYIEKKHEGIKSIVKDVINKGFSNRDICILCRTKKKAIGIAEFLITNKIDVVSSESLLITNSAKVRLVIGFLKLYNNPDDELALAEFVTNYNIFSESIGRFHNDFNSLRGNKFDTIDKIFKHLNINSSKEDLIALSVYEIAEFVYREIIKDIEADVFIQYLFDFISNSSLPLNDFITRWEEKCMTLFITMPDDLDAIKIMTIHKAKGLDFPIVIIDAENVRNPNTKNEFWDDLDIEEIPELKVGLFPLSKKIELINKSEIYEKEVQKTELDFLNLIYVAFTRPVFGLFTVSQIGSRDKFSEYINRYLVMKGIWNENKSNYTFGELGKHPKGNDTSISNTIKLKKFISSKWTELIKVAPSENIDRECSVGKSSRSYGKLIHGLLSNIYYTDDTDNVINQLEEAGILSVADLAIVNQTIRDIVSNSHLSQFFQNNLIVKNETEILLSNGKVIRPDRVVINGEILTIIDYKTGDHKQEDIKQLKTYRDAFSQLGYSKIESKLVYIGDMISIIDVN